MTLRVRLEIVPFGDESRAYEIGRLDISNMGRVDPEDLCAYKVVDLTKGQEGQYDATVLHRRRRGAWELVREVIEQLVGGTDEEAA